jgi:hypothetical protein
MPSRVLRHGDLLSPYLLVCRRWSSPASSKGGTELEFAGVKYLSLRVRDLSLALLRITHCCFFEGRTGVIKQVIKDFERGIGQLINSLKCSMIFGSKCTQQNREKVMEILNIANAVGEGKYLRLSTPEGRMNKDKFKTTKESLVKSCSS